MGDRMQGANGCCHLPALDDLDLIAAIDGEASPEVLSHLRVCGSCAARAQHFASLQGMLRKQLFRMFCPTTDDLVAFHQGCIAPEQRGSIDEHLLDCPHCYRELSLLQEIGHQVMSGRPPPHFHQAHDGGVACQVAPPTRSVVAELMQPDLPPALLSIFGAPRGPDRSDQYAYQAENLQITIDVHRMVNRAERRVLTGALSLDEDLPQSGCHASAYSARTNQLIRTAELDELGNFIFDDMSPGLYRLALSLPDREVVIEAISL